MSSQAIKRRSEVSKEQLPAQKYQRVDLPDDNEFQEWVRNVRSLRLLVIGIPGVGKSTLLNAILGECVFEEGDDVSRCQQTEDIHHEYVERGLILEKEVKEVKVIAIDTPGLLETEKSSKENVYAHLEELINTITKNGDQDIDLVLFCIKMSNTLRACELLPSLSALKHITQNLNGDIWKKTIFVLTFANIYVRMLDVQSQQGELSESKFRRRIEEIQGEISRALTEENVSTEDLIVCPAGHYNEVSFSGQEAWLSNLWAHILKGAHDRAKPALLQLIANRIVCPGRPEAERPMVVVLTDKLKEALSFLIKPENAGIIIAAIGAALATSTTTNISSGVSLGLSIGSTLTNTPTMLSLPVVGTLLLRALYDAFHTSQSCSDRAE